MKYYLVDWVAIIFSIISIYYLGNSKKVGFVFGVVGSISWLVVNIIAQITPGIIFSVFMIYMNINGFYKWKKEEVKVKTNSK